jgi:uncharacterized protein (DUF302 family)
MTRGEPGVESQGSGGVATVVSPFSFEETVRRLLADIEHKGLRLFGVIDHQAAAAEVGLVLRPTKVLVFGSPKAGTPLMVEWPLLALELPLRIVVWADDDGRAHLGFLTAGALADQFHLDEGQAAALGAPVSVIHDALGVDRWSQSSTGGRGPRLPDS